LTQYILTITAQDRPGIVAAASETVMERGGNIEAASQTVHQGYFTMILLCQFAAPQSAETMAELIKQKAGEDMHVYFTAYQPVVSDVSGETQVFIVTLVGPDRPGILHNLTSYLASHRININDLYSCVTDGNFITICQVSVPASVDIRMVQADLEAAGGAWGYRAHLQHANIFAAINDLSFGSVK
jgi:glycine cleavage system transcriptional repressor